MRLVGRGPTRTAEKLEDGRWRVTVTPPEWSGFTRGSTMILTQDQYDKYLEWQTSSTPIQRVFPEMTRSQREALLSGITDEEWEEKL